MQVLLLAAALSAFAEVPRLALDVANPHRVGRTVIHLEDTVGPKARSIGGLEAAKAVLVFATATEDCPECAGDLERLQKVHAAAAKKGGLVVALVLSRPTAQALLRKRFAQAPQDLVIALDPWGLGRRRLGLVGPGEFVVLRSDGSVTRSAPERAKALDAAEAALLTELEEDG